MTNDPTRTLGYLLHDTTRQMRRRLDRIAAQHGLTRAQWQLLAVLSRDDGSNQATIAERLDLEPISVCRLVDRMEAGGLVERRADPDDRRMRRIFMTDVARPAFAAIRHAADSVFEEAFAGFSAAERGTLMTLLERCNANLSEAPPTAGDTAEPSATIGRAVA
ncbi:MarR family winged helix-turn-helix transcriptional regulator [Methylobrevis pamukkalensis]|uniref:Transcriptional regulator SlyA n=1 Tax=Methylobrevis pamukkalensis TaxID=1439726 RepID=A0A1E3GY43_9HYPH|nr:MarR family transcriptional regulator [Methylobrevis pamukkalensis]ODN68963.1 Transcriptional regulator SlyA [Methylobrevis pamukkalensis]